MVGRHLAAIDTIFRAHPFLDEGVTGSGHDRDAAGLLHLFFGIPGQPRIVEDLAAGLLHQHFPGQKTHDIIALDEAAGFIPEEAAVEIAVPGDAQIRVMLADRAGRLFPVFRKQRVWNAVGKGTVRLMVKPHELKRQMLRQEVHDSPGTAIAAVDDDLKRRKLPRLDVAQQVPDIVALVVVPEETSGRSGGAGQVACCDQPGHLFQPRFAGDRPRPFNYQLHAVVVGRIVAGGDDHAPVDAVRFHAEGGVIDLFGAAEPQIDYVGAHLLQAFCQRCAKFLAAQPDIASDHDLLETVYRGETATDLPGEFRIQLVRNSSPDIVCFEGDKGVCGHFLFSFLLRLRYIPARF